MEEIYSQINQFRANSLVYGASCHTPLALPPLGVSPALEQAALWQVEHLCEPVSHKTCPELCHLFGGCSRIDRINHFTYPNVTHHQEEVLIKGPRRNQFKHLLRSFPHCNHLLDTAVNCFGGALVGDTFILDFAHFPQNRCSR